MNEMPEHLKPAKEEDAPEGYTLCKHCEGQKLVGPDGEACVCAVYGQHAGYMQKQYTTTWGCIICSDAIIQKENSSQLSDEEIFKTGPPEPWANREIVYEVGTEHENTVWRGVCPKCKDLPNEEAYKRVDYLRWKFAEDVVMDQEEKSRFCKDCPHKPLEPLPKDVMGDTKLAYYDCPCLLFVL